MYLDWESPKKFGGHGPRFRNTGANKRVGNNIGLRVMVRVIDSFLPTIAIYVIYK